MTKPGKRWRKASEAVDSVKLYAADAALLLVKNNAQAKFDETVEISVNLGVDPKQSDQQVRGVVSLPNGTGKTVRVAVFARGDKAAEALAAGADVVGADDLVEAINKGVLNFDRCIATPDMMGNVGKVAKVLGPRGLMPNPKTGTVTVNVAQAIKDVKGGQVEFRLEKAGIVQAGIGKASFSVEALKQNFDAFMSAVQKAKPTGVKGNFIKKISVSSTMGAGVKVDLSTLVA